MDKDENKKCHNLSERPGISVGGRMDLEGQKSVLLYTWTCKCYGWGHRNTERVNRREHIYLKNSNKKTLYRNVKANDTVKPLK